MLGNKNQQGISGNHNQQAGENIFNFYPSQSKDHTPSAIERVLQGLYSIGTEQIQFFPPDILPYTLEEKIDFNGIKSYTQFYDDFLEGCGLVKLQIERQSEVAPECETALIHCVKSFYRKISIQFPNDTADEKIDKICQCLSDELQQSGANLILEERRAVEYVVFYVFSECKIFNKPPSSYASPKSITP